MGSKLIEMRKIRELLRLNIEQGLSAREAAQRVGIGKTAASEYIFGFKSCGLTLKEVLELSDTDIGGILSLKKISTNDKYQQLLEKFPDYEKELKRVGVTLQLLWTEYKEKFPEGYRYSQFCHHFDQWQRIQKVSMHIEHKAGDKMYVDFAGQTHPIFDPQTGESIECQVFLSVLGASQIAYIEAVATQTKADWIQMNENALRFYGGVPRAIVPDCLKSAVTKADKYEPVINETFLDFGRHYNTTILPARALHPKDYVNFIIM